MHRFLALLTLLILLPARDLSAQSCNGRVTLGLARTVEIDASTGPIFGDITRAAKEASFLAPKEVVLTFDDGPMPWITGSILDTLDRHCTKATFFSVGRMAVAYPETTHEIVIRGHTLGTHTWSHPLSIGRLPVRRSVDEIERGFAAVAMAAGRPIAPFFRFPGLSDSGAMLAHLQSRGIASFTVDVVSDDSFIADPKRLAQLTLQRIEQRQGGIVLFHDIKSSTAKALPVILDELAQRGYRVVHMTSAQPVTPMGNYEPELGPMLAKVEVAAGGRRQLMPFYGAASTLRPAASQDVPVSRVISEPRPRLATHASKTSPTKQSVGPGLRRAPAVSTKAPAAWAGAVTVEGNQDTRRARRQHRQSDLLD
jgi:peptidoglycan/xylan/chitin deacetylase (PgdA/CDA1 family)